MIISPVVVGGAEAKVKGFGNLTPANSMLRDIRISFDSDITPLGKFQNSTVRASESTHTRREQLQYPAIDPKRSAVSVIGSTRPG
jgi:hypothetical protein